VNPDLMNPDPMSDDAHELARLMIALSGPEELSQADQSWLNLHLDSCLSCREFADATRETIRSMRAISITAGERLVSATQSRVRQRAQQLQRLRERLWIVCVCCAAVTLCTAISTAMLWGGFAWVSQTWASQTWFRQAWMSPPARLSAPVWVIGFLLLAAAPAVFTAILLLARGTHLADHTDSFQG